MAAQLLSLHLLYLLMAGVMTDPSPGRIPKVYNALITSNQNLEPSKAYPVYQPVLHDTAFAFPLQPTLLYRGDFPVSNGLFPAPILPPKDPSASPSPPAPTPESLPEAKSPSTEAAPPSDSKPDSDSKSTPAPPPPPNTQSPIPLNEFGLPSQVLPLGRIDPAYDGFTQVGPFTYTYPSLRFYDPYDPFSLHPYSLPPLYRPLANVLGHAAPVLAGKEAIPAAATISPTEKAAPSPPSEPNDLNVLNYSSKDPAIPNVPPPPLPQGGLKSDKSE